MEELKKITKILKALSDEGRVRIISLLLLIAADKIKSTRSKNTILITLIVVVSGISLVQSFSRFAKLLYGFESN